MIKATQLRPGMIIKHEGDLCVIYSVDHRTPGNKRGSMQTKMRNLRNGNMMDFRFRAEETLEKVVVDEIPFEYLYSDGDGHHFMNVENYEQLALRDHARQAVQKSRRADAACQRDNHMPVIRMPACFTL